MQFFPDFLLYALRDGKFFHKLRQLLRQPVRHVGGLQAARQYPDHFFLNQDFLRRPGCALQLCARQLERCVFDVFRRQLLRRKRSHFLPSLLRKMLENLIHSGGAQNPRQRRVRFLRITFLFQQGALLPGFHQPHKSPRVRGPRSSLELSAQSRQSAAVASASAAQRPSRHPPSPPTRNTPPPKPPPPPSSPAPRR